MLEMIIGLHLQAFIPIILTAAFIFLEKKTRFKKLGYMVKQTVIGVFFGLAAVLSTETGTNVEGVVMNVRDAAPICAGFIFGAPAAVIAGFIGGVERMLCVLWGGGQYTVIACSAATIFAGLFAAWLRRHMFENKAPIFYSGLAAGTIIEVIHMLLVMITHPDDINKAFTIVRVCTIPMVLLNGISVMAALAIVNIIDRRKNAGRATPSLSKTIQDRLLVCVSAAVVITGSFTYFVNSDLTESETGNILSLNISDVKQDVSDAADESIMKLARKAAADCESYRTLDDLKLRFIKGRYELSEVSYIGADGIIKYSTNPKSLNYDMSSGEQSREFMVLLSGEKEFVQEYRPISQDSSVNMKYAGISLSYGGFIQVGYDRRVMEQEIALNIKNAVRNRHIKESGYMMVIDEKHNVISDKNEDISSLLPDNRDNEVFEAVISEKDVYCMYDISEGYTILAVIGKSEAEFSHMLSLYLSLFIEVIVYYMLFIQIYFLLKWRVTNKVSRINTSLAAITDGKLDTKVSVTQNREFAELSGGINQTVDALKKFIEREAKRNEKDLELAKFIQHSSIPNVFPPFPEIHEFEIYASMDTAKEVGGDFYDFFFVGMERVAFLIADVSGKGIPAAMFMMRARSVIKSLAETGKNADEVFTAANKMLCQNNAAEMFVTAWLGILDINTGAVTFANAGHNPPAMKKGNGGFEFFRSRPGFVLAGMDGIVYKKGELTLEPGDEIFLYTDGITEATDAKNNLYGDDRLISCLNTLEKADTKEKCKGVKADVDRFVGDAPQFDDMTMLLLKFFGKGDKK